MLSEHRVTLKMEYFLPFPPFSLVLGFFSSFADYLYSSLPAFGEESLYLPTY